MSDNKKTTEQLLAELEALKKKLEERDGAPAADVPPAVSSALITRRALSGWVAPVILSLPVVATIGNPREARAQYYPPTDDAPPIVSLPTVAPTKGPPSRAPTNAAPPPTRAGRCVPVPTTAPTLGMASAPDGRPSPAGLVALGGARAAVSALS